MADNKRMEEYLKTLIESNEASKDQLQDQREIRDVILDQVKQLKFQQTLKKDISKTINDIYKVQYDLNLGYDEELGTSKSLRDIKKQITTITKSQLALQNDIDDLDKSRSEYSKELVSNLKKQQNSARELLASLEDQEKTSKKINNNLGTSGFQFLAELTEKMGGKASKLSQPFQKMADASRDAVKSGVLQNKKIDERKKLLEKIKKGEVIANRKTLGDMEILSKSGRRLYGKDAKKALEEGTNQSIKGLGGRLSKSKIAVKGLGAGFKALGPIISKALGPLAIAKALIDIGKFFIDAMFAADKQIVGLGRNLSMSVKSAEKLRDYYSDNKSLLQSTVKLTEDIVNAQNQLNKLSAIGLVYSLDTVDAQIQLTRELKLTEEEASNLNKLFIVNGESSTKTLNDAFDTTAEYANQTGTLFNTSKILSKMSKISGQILASFKGNTKELQLAVMKAEKLGINLGMARDMSQSLLNFESSISAEMEAELLTGRSLNLDRARALALQGDYLGASEAVLENFGDLEDFQNMNVFQQNAIAKAAGLTADQLADALITQKFQGTETGKQIQRMKEMGMVEEANALAQGELTGAQLAQAQKQLTAAESFENSLARAKEIFSDLVTGGALQSIADALQAIADSALVAPFKRQGEAKRIQKELKDNKDVTKEERQTINQATNQMGVIDYIKSALINPVAGLTGAAIRDRKQQVALVKSVAIEQKYKSKPIAEDFIMRPGQGVQKFRKDDIVIGGTNLLGGDNNGNNEVISLLKELIHTVKSGGDVYMDGNKVGKSLAMATSNFS